MTSGISYNLVAPRPKDQARYTIRELLILGLTLPVRFCPLNKFGPEALGLEIVSLERINEGLWNFEREQWRMWRAAQFETRKNLQTAAMDRMRRTGTAATQPSPQQKVEDHETGEKRTIRPIQTRIETYRSSQAQDSLHFQIPASHSGAPLNINIGLSLDYTSLPPTTAAKSEGGNASRPWTTKPKQSASLSELLKDAPGYTKPSAATPSPAAIPAIQQVPVPEDSPHEEEVVEHDSPQEVPQELVSVHGTPPMETVLPSDVGFAALGTETPSSMAVERFTEPSLHSFSPTSSIRGTPSDADFSEQPSPLNFSSPTPQTSPAHRHFASSGVRDSPLGGSTATLVAGDSPKSLSDQSLYHEPGASGEGGDDYVVVSGTPSERNWGLASSTMSTGSANASRSISSSSIATGKAFLGKGKIDAKAQDEFIAFMLGKK